MLNRLLLVVCTLAAIPYFVSSYEVTIKKTATGFIIQPKETKNDENNKLSPRIIGGSEVTPHYYDFQAALLIFKGTDTYFCGGTLITNQWVLTAAHCLEMKPSVITVILGAHDLLNLDSNTIQLFNSTKYKHHSDWDGKTYQNDIGLIRLPNVVTLNKYVNVAKLASGTDTYVDKDAVTLGWGQTETEELSTVLKQVTSKIISNDDCAKADPSYKNIIKSMHICISGEGPKGSCNGDSGGPLLVDGVQVGIVSFGTTDCTLGLPSVFARETDFNGWIKDHLTDDGYDDNGGDDDDNDDDDDDNDDDDDDNDDGGASTHSLLFVAIASTVMCLVRSFGLM